MGVYWEWLFFRRQPQALGLFFSSCLLVWIKASAHWIKYEKLNVQPDDVDTSGRFQRTVTCSDLQDQWHRLVLWLVDWHRSPHWPCCKDYKALCCYWEEYCWLKAASEPSQVLELSEVHSCFTFSFSTFLAHRQWISFFFFQAVFPRVPQLFCCPRFQLPGERYKWLLGKTEALSSSCSGSTIKPSLSQETSVPVRKTSE